MALSAEARRLTQIRERMPRDAALHLIASVFTSSIPADIPLGVVVDGVVMIGRLQAPERGADHLDQTIARLLTGASVRGLEEDAAQEWRQEMSELFRSGYFRTLVERDNEAQEAAEEIYSDFLESLNEGDALPSTVDDWPEEGFEYYARFAGPDPVLVLDKVQAVVGGAGWVDLGTVRVLVQRVSAWWLPSEPDPARSDDRTAGR